MFLVRIARNADVRYAPLTVDASQYLYDFAAFVARSVPDAEVHACLGEQAGDEIVFLGKALEAGEVELF